jgi:CheY-like chemotaxis protein
MSYPEAPPGEFIIITVSDTGIGMTNEVLRQLFEPFFTTKEKGKGTGLGLATAYGIVNQHRGWIEVASELGRGATFQVVLPRGEAVTPLEEAISAPASERLPGSETVLVVEDDTSVRSILCGMLSMMASGLRGRLRDDALLVWRDRCRDIDLVVTDLVMPGSVDGRALAIRLREDRPELRLILTTGYVDKAIDEEEIAGSGLTLLRKPYTADEFLITVRQILDQSKS